MRGLLLKDFYMAKSYCRSYLLITAVFLAVSCISADNMFYLVYPALLSGLMPSTLLAYDERCGFQTFGGAMPFTKKQYVTGKYVFGFICQLVMVLLTAAVYAASRSAAGNFHMTSFASTMGFVIGTACTAASFSLPFMFRFGVEKGRIAYYVAIGVMCALASVMSLGMVDPQAPYGRNLSPLFAAAGGLALYILSWALSVKLYTKKEE